VLFFDGQLQKIIVMIVSVCKFPFCIPHIGPIAYNKFACLIITVVNSYYSAVFVCSGGKVMGIVPIKGGLNVIKLNETE
jgi:hypothetical protein